MEPVLDHDRKMRVLSLLVPLAAPGVGITIHDGNQRLETPSNFNETMRIVVAAVGSYFGITPDEFTAWLEQQ